MPTPSSVPIPPYLRCRSLEPWTPAPLRSCGSHLLAGMLPHPRAVDRSGLVRNIGHAGFQLAMLVVGPGSADLLRAESYENREAKLGGSRHDRVLEFRCWWDRRQKLLAAPAPIPAIATTDIDFIVHAGREEGQPASLAFRLPSRPSNRGPVWEYAPGRMSSSEPHRRCRNQRPASAWVRTRRGHIVPVGIISPPLLWLPRQDLFKLPHQCLTLLNAQAIEILLPPSDSRQVGGTLQVDGGPIGLAPFERQ